MIQQVCSTSLPLIVYNPAGTFSMDYFRHCAEAGALPVFDTEFFSDRDALSRTGELADSGFLFGLRVAAERGDLLREISRMSIAGCDALVVYYNRPEELRDLRREIAPCPVIVEVTDIEINEILEKVPPSALILKGYEAQGKVSRYTSFVLQQWYIENSRFPFFVQGGVGFYTAPGIFAAGASGVVLDSQLLLADESPVSEPVRQLLCTLEESDSSVITGSCGTRRRFFSRLGTKIVRDLKKKGESGFYKDGGASLYDDIRENYSPLSGITENPAQKLFYLGQDAIFAKHFAKDYKKTGDIIRNFFSMISDALSMIDDHDPLTADSALAVEHGTKYPIVQGPMANISDNIEFAGMVYNGGALPFFAVGSLPPDVAEQMLSAGEKNVPRFGAGMIGVPAFNRYLAEHMKIVKKENVPFALFAAGNPSLIKELDAAGTKGYLHTPSMSMLTNAISAGCRRFIFEGTEAGGHVGNLTSMVLWELALVTANSLPVGTLSELRLIFAGGVGTPRGSHFISGMTSSTAAKGCGIGVQVATAYLFTKEIVESGALNTLYQDVLCREKGTILIGDTVGLPARTIASPFSRHIHENEIRRALDNIPLTERKELFEHDNTGSLLIGAKAFHLEFSEAGEVNHIPVDENEQYEKGNFMAGDIIACDEKQITIEDVHNRIIYSKEEMFRTLNDLEILFGAEHVIHDEIAIIGMGCIYPDARGPEEFWNNIRTKRYSICEMPESRLKPYYYDSDRKAEDKTYTKIAGLVKDYSFDYRKFGMTEDEGGRISRSLQMILDAASQAVEDAGYGGNGRALPSERTAVIIASCLTNEMNSDLQLKYYAPEILSMIEQLDGFKSLAEDKKRELRDHIKKGLAQGHYGETADGASVQMESAGVASHFGIKGINCTVDAACASSLAALDAGRRELLSGAHDMAIIGGVNTNLSVESFVGFCKMGALSAEGSFPFDERAGGFVLGEGAGVVIMKRMKDALRDGDRVLAVLKGIGSSSDGKGKAIAAPNPDGQEYALNRCYDSLVPGTGIENISYIEAHGTSTLMGDYAELETLKKYFANVTSGIGLSSVKSQIGHLLGGAGIAGLIKVILALKNRELPSNGLYEKLSHRFNLDGSPLYIITENKPWEPGENNIRTAAVSSFGFGGVNYHCVISEMTERYIPVNRGRIFNPGTKMNDGRIVIAGAGTVLPGITSTDELKNILNGEKYKPVEIPVSRFNNNYYMNEQDESYTLPHLKAGVADDSLIDGRKYRMPPATIRSVDRCQFIGLECSKQALEQSGAGINLPKGNNTAVIIGTASGEKMVENIIRTRVPLIQQIIRESEIPGRETIAEALAVSLKKRFHMNNEDTVPGLLSNIVSGRIANYFGLNGVNFIVNAGEESSAVAMRLAFLGLRSGEYESVITGGVDSNLTPAVFMALKQRGFLSPDREGKFLSEGGALFMLTTYRNAVEKDLTVLASIDSADFSSAAITIQGEPSRYTPVSGHSNSDSITSMQKNETSGYFRNAGKAVAVAKELAQLQNRDAESKIHKEKIFSANENIVKKEQAQTVSLHSSAGSGYTEADGSFITLLLTGQGAQRSGMMKELYSTSGIIRETLDRGEAVFRDERGYSILDIMFGGDPAINSTENTQPAVFLSSAALFNVLNRDGLKPRYFIGHSLGECTALYCAGLLGFDETMRLVLRRSSLMKEASENIPGEIMAVFKGWKDTSELIKEAGAEEVFVANKNSDAQTVVAGRTEGISALIDLLKKRNVIYKKLPLSGAFHTPLFSGASDGLRSYLSGVKFNETDYTAIISNATAKPYPQDEAAVKELLLRQVISPVEFIESVRYACSNSAPCFIEAGPAGILTGLLKNISAGVKFSKAAVNHKNGEHASFEETRELILEWTKQNRETLMTSKPEDNASAIERTTTGKSPAIKINSLSGDDPGFREYLENNRDNVESLLYDEYRRHRLLKEFEKIEQFGFYPGSIVVSGVSIGLPGKSREVFSDDNFNCILKGENRIDLLANEDLKMQLAKKITRINKKSDGSAVLQKLSNEDEVVHLAGQLGHFDRRDYGIEFENDKSDALAMAAGLEALRDAGIPLVPVKRKTSTGSYLFSGYALPDEMQETTGVIRTSIFAGFESLIGEVERYTMHKNANGPYRLFEQIYYLVMENVRDEEIKGRLTEWFFSLKNQGFEKDYSFNRNLLLKMGFMGAPQFAQMIKAKGPNTQLNSACASMTQGICMAEDWIRTGRCERVIVTGSESVDPENLGQWLYAGFLAIGAATVEKNVSAAAKPFDALRNGTILGSGAAAVIVERADAVKNRGRAGQAEILATVTGNSAFHGTRIDVSHIAGVMNKMITRAEKMHRLNREEYTRSMIFMSHETFTPAVGGSAQAEIDAIKGTYPGHYKNIVISNTKGYTGHTLGGGLEDPVMIKALQSGVAPAIANLKNIPREFSDLTFSRGDKKSYNYGLHFAAGFGSHFSMLFVKRINETAADNPVYLEWLKKVSGYEKPELALINKTLCIRSQGNDDIKSIPLIEEPVKPLHTADVKTMEKKSEPEVSINTENTPAADTSSIKETIKNVIAEQTGYTPDMLEDDMDLEADLGIDTVKQVEIFEKISSLYSLEVPEDLKLSDMNTIAKLVQYIASKVTLSSPAGHPEATEITIADPDISAIKDGIKNIIAEQTGYTPDMLEDGLDLEADLGIDTVKQVEIFGKISALYSLEVPEDLKLSDMNTIAKLVEYIASKVTLSSPAHSEVTESIMAGPGLSSIKEGIKNIIAEQTGYTPDMLEDGLDLEADLGIDTVKQVEIFGKISALYSLEVPEDLKLSDMNTIEKLVEYISSKINQLTPAAHAVKTTETVKTGKNADNMIHRFTISVKQLEGVLCDSRTFEGKTFLISRESYGFTEKISEKIKSKGGKVFTIGFANADCIADMTDPADVEKKLSEFALNHRDINSFIHLSPLDFIITGEDTTPGAIESSVKSLFIIIKTMNGQLRQKGSIIASLSFNSVVFPYCENPGRINPVSGAIAGMLKTVNKEFSDAVVKAVDFSALHPEKVIDETTDNFIREILSGDTRVEVGYRGGERFGLTLNDEPAANGKSLIHDGSTLLVTGGAGGITFEILLKMASGFKNLKLIIFDRLDIDSLKREFLSDTVDENFIISALKKKMPVAKPLEIKNAASLIMKTKTAYSNISRLKKMGVKIDYHAVDVTSSDSVSRALKKYKRIDGIIHAAGMEESQVIEKMTLDSFNRVFNVKGYGVLNLISALSKIEYDFFAAFSSVSARFGNEGQINYSGANEMLSKSLFRERAVHKSRTYKVYDWTAWEGAGMATNETVNKVLKERGMTFLPLEQGIELFLAELRDEKSVESIFTGTDRSFDRDGILPGSSISEGNPGSPVSFAAPFLDSVIESGRGRMTFARTIDLTRDLFMKDHSRDGIPLFLGATGIETMAEAASKLSGEGAFLRELRDFIIPYSIKILKGRPKELLIEASSAAESDRGIECRITSLFKNPAGVIAGEPTLHYKGSYIFGEKSEQPVVAVPHAGRVENGADFQETIYHPQRLFMDGVFRTVQGIHSFDGELLVTRIKHAPSREFFAGITDPSFLVDVVLIDAMFQTGGIFEMLTTSDIILPSKINRMVFHQSPDKNREYLCFTKKISSDDENTTFSLLLTDYEGRVYMDIDRFDMVKITRVPHNERIDKKFRIAG